MNILQAKHWQKYGITAAFQVGQAANNSPPMKYNPRPFGIGQSFSAQTVFLVQEAYNLLAASKYPLALRQINISTGRYDKETADAIRSFQTLTNLSFPDGNAGAETLMKMDQLLLEFENHQAPTIPANPWRDWLRGF